MRLVVVGHSYLTRFAQAKYLALKQVVPALSLRLIVPTHVRHVFGVFEQQRAEGLHEQEVVPLHPWMFHSHMTYSFNPSRVAGILKAFQPQHVHIEEDPHSVIGTEMVTLSRRVCPSARVSFFIWDNLARTPRFPLGAIKRSLTTYSLGRCDLVICGNVEAQRLLAGKGYHGQSLVLPQQGLDPADYSAPPRPETLARVRGSQPGAIVVGFVGRFVPEKGIIELLTALESLQEFPWRCVCVGRGPLGPVLRGEWARRLGNRLVVMDPVPHDAVADLMKCLDVFVYYSRSEPFWKEQLGLGLVQAMMAGAACVGSSSGAIPEVIADAGLIVPEQSQQALTAALRGLLSAPSERESLGRRGRERALARFTHRAVAEQYADAFWGREGRG